MKGTLALFRNTRRLPLDHGSTKHIPIANLVMQEAGRETNQEALAGYSLVGGLSRCVARSRARGAAPR